MAALGDNNGLTVTEAARRVRLPRTTTYRVLETLRAGGYVLRDDMDRYRQTEKGRRSGQATAPTTSRTNGHADAA
jgi:DNA-binding IclR family transcriptional regulator